MTAPLFVVGHKNGDVDAVASAAALAHFMRQTKRTNPLNLPDGIGQIIAARHGAVTPDLQYILSEASMPLKEIVSLEDLAGKLVVMVDHNDAQQAVPGIENARVLGIVDHHQPGNVVNAPYIHIHRLGSSSSIVAGFFNNSSLLVPRPIATLLLGGILTDTKILRSNCTPHALRAVQWLAPIVGLDPERFGQDIFYSLQYHVIAKNAGGASRAR
jgi:manganese-dependent inorganic pyrophosphatase